MTSNAQLQREAELFKRRAGIKFDNGRIADVSTKPATGYVWIEQQIGPNQYGKPVQILNQAGLNRIGAHVLIGRTEGDQPVVVAVDVVREQQRGSDTGASTVNTQTQWVPTGLLQEFKPIALGTTEIAVLPGFLPTGVFFSGGQTTTLDTLIGGLSSDEHLLAFVHVTLDGNLESPASTAKSTLDPLTPADFAEARAGASPGALPVIPVQLTEGQTEINIDSFWVEARMFMNAPLAYSEADVSNPPTAAELTSAFGDPAVIGRLIGLVNDNGAGSNEYLVWNDGAAWFYVAGTAAS